MPEAEQKTVQIAFRVTEGRHTQLRQAAVDRDTSIQAMLEAGLELLLSSPPSQKNVNAKDKKLLADLTELAGTKEVQRMLAVLAKLAGK